MHEPPLKNDERLDELILAWEESAASGNPLSTEVLCRDCPELAVELKRKIGRLSAIDRFMFPGSTHATDGPGRAALSSSGGHRFPTLPGYEILEEIGKGGMGVVYMARQLSLGRVVAVKTLAGSRWGMPGFVARLRQEAQALSRLNDPHVVQVIDVVETADLISLVLEYVEGGNLAKRLNGAPLPVTEAAQLALNLAETLARVHAVGLLHRDIKPANVLIDRAGEIKITDFGLAKEAGATDGLTVTGDVLGSPGYMAPEQALGRTADIDVRTDVYAFGATLYEMLTGRPPFVGGSVVETLDQVRQHEPVPPRLLNPSVPRDLETVCLKCLEKEPVRRFTSATELADELRRYLRGEPIHSRPIGAFDRCRRWCRRRPAAAALIAVSGAALLVIFAVLFVYNRDLSRLNTDLGIAADEAKHLQHIAQDKERQTGDALYAADISRGAIALNGGDVQGLTELLNRHIPADGDPDRRGFEWWYLRRQSHRAHQVLLDIDSPLYSLCYSPDQRQLATAGKDAKVRLFAPQTGEIIREITTGQIEVNGMAFSPDSKELATTGDDGTIRFWNLKTGVERLKIAAYPTKAFQVAFTSDGKRIVSGGDDPVIRIFAADSGEKIQSLEGHVRTIQSLVVADGGKLLVTSSDDCTARVWNLTTGTETARVTSEGFVWPVVVAPERNLLITGNAFDEVETWGLREGRKISAVRHLDAVHSLALHPGGRLLAAGDHGGGVRLWSLGADGEIIPVDYRVWQAHQGTAYGLVWSRDGSRLISAGKDGRVMSWSLAAIQSNGPRKMAADASTAFCLIPKTTSLVTSGAHERSLVRWNWVTGTQEGRFVDPVNVGDVKISPDGRLLAEIWDGRVLNVLPLDEVFRPPPHANWVSLDWNPSGELGSLQFSPDSQTIAIPFQPDGSEGNQDARCVWLHGPPKFQTREQVPVPGAKAVAFAADGKRLALVCDAGLVLWDISQRTIIRQNSQSDLTDVAFSPDGRLLVTGGTNRLAIIWNVADGSIRFKLASHRSPIVALAISPDSTTLATGSKDGVIKLWHIATGQELFELRGQGGKCHRLEFAEDGRHLFALVDAGPGGQEILAYQAGEGDPDE